MKISRMACAVALIIASALTVDMTVNRAQAETHVVKMLNKHPEDAKQRQIFYPAVLRVAPGDTVKFISSDKGHNTASVTGAIPDNAEPWKSKFGKDFEVTLTDEGTYQYLCTPHYGMGMVGVILVGDHTVNLENVKAKKHPGKAKKIFADLMDGL